MLVWSTATALRAARMASGAGGSGVSILLSMQQRCVAVVNSTLTWLAATTSRTARINSSAGGAGISMRAAPSRIRLAFAFGRNSTMRPFALRCAF